MSGVNTENMKTEKSDSKPESIKVGDRVKLFGGHGDMIVDSLHRGRATCIDSNYSKHEFSVEALTVSMVMEREIDCLRGALKRAKMSRDLDNDELSNLYLQIRDMKIEQSSRISRLRAGRVFLFFGGLLAGWGLGWLCHIFYALLF